MGLIDIRALLEYPDNGNNSTDTVINGIHFNKTALNEFHYSLFSNNTISNGSSCYLIFDQFKPVMMSNGSWVNATTCYIPYYQMGTRGATGIAVASLFAISIVFTLVNLRKHGKRFLKEDKRFRIVGRRWQWYWMLFVAACGMISCITGIDVDRNYLQSTAIVLQGAFYSLMFPGMLAMVWEAVRHWGSWQERQVVDVDPFSLRQDDRRSRTEFYLPLLFYLFAWLCFFMTVPRPWTPLEKQRSDWQQDTVAEPAGTDNRLKAGAILAAVAWFIIIVSLVHSIYQYKPRATSPFKRFINFFRFSPPKLSLTIAILAVRVGYAIASAWLWDISIFKYDVNVGLPFGLGYGCALLIILVFEIAGAIEQNEDRVIIQQRRVRGARADSELGITHKPSWWRQGRQAAYMTEDERLRHLAEEVGGSRPRRASYELDEINAAAGYSRAGDGNNSNRADDPAAATTTTTTTTGPAATAVQEPANPFRDPNGRPAGAERGVSDAGLPSDASIASGTTYVSDTTRSSSTSTTNPGRQQQIRSMLDV
jgi:hypothetical protein